MKNSGNSKMVTAILAGAAIGGITWFLMRTERGKEYWSAVMDGAKDLSHKLQDSVEDRKKDLERMSERASDYVSKKASEASKFADKQLKNMNAKIESASS